MLARLALLLFGFWAGAVPFGVLIAKWLRGVEIRDHGSGKNPCKSPTSHINPLVFSVRAASPVAARETLLQNCGRRKRRKVRRGSCR